MHAEGMHRKPARCCLALGRGRRAPCEEYLQCPQRRQTNLSFARKEAWRHHRFWYLERETYGAGESSTEASVRFCFHFQLPTVSMARSYQGPISARRDSSRLITTLPDVGAACLRGCHVPCCTANPEHERVNEHLQARMVPLARVRRRR